MLCVRVQNPVSSFYIKTSANCGKSILNKTFIKTLKYKETFYPGGLRNFEKNNEFR
jgi:hypothetical protein